MGDRAKEIAREIVREFMFHEFDPADGPNAGEHEHAVYERITEALLTFSEERVREEREKIGEALVIAMRWWKMHAEITDDDDNRDLNKEDTLEGRQYRQCLALLGLNSAIRREATK